MLAPPVEFPADAIRRHRPLPQFNIRNGLWIATIPSTYHWSPIKNMFPEKAIANVKAFINVAHTQVSTMENTSNALKRKIAICLGVSRAVATANFHISNEDLFPSETAPSMLKLGDNENVFEVLVNPTTKACYEMDNITNFSDVENQVITSLISATLGTVPLQGFSLLVCYHHYLSDPKGQSRRAFATVEKQFFNKGVIASWFEPDAEILRDILWHKACHPINLRIKYDVATDEETKDMLVKNGVGSAASWLPAMEIECRALSSYMKLFQAVEPIWAKFGAGIDCGLLEVVLDTVERFVPGVEDPVHLTPMDERIPQTVVNRRSAIMWADEVRNRNAPKVAVAFGFYETMVNQTDNLEGGLDYTSLSLTSSHSLKKLRTTHLLSYTMGIELFRDYNAARIRLRASLPQLIS